MPLYVGRRRRHAFGVTPESRVVRCFTKASPWFSLFLLVACVKNPVTGTRELSLLSAEDERRIGAEAAREVEETVGLVEHNAMTPFVRRLGTELAALSPRPDVSYQFDIVDMLEPNAFALPDGHIYVSRGILALTNTEDELAGILGHEIGHVAARHANQRFSRAAPVGILTGITSSVVGVVSDTAASSIAGLGAGLNAVILAPHSRDQERQADEVGQDLAAKAGYDPEGLSRALTALKRMDRYAHGVQQTNWLDSHPATEERVTETRAHAKSLQILSPRQAPASDYVRRLEGLVLGANARYGVFEDHVFVHPELVFSIAFPKGWLTQNSRKMVGAQAPGGDALCLLGAAGTGLTPQQTAQRFAEVLEITYSSGPSQRTINGHAAAQAQLSTEEVEATFAFIAHQSIVYQLIALSKKDRHSHYAPELERWLTSFDTATPRQLQNVTETRLRIVDVQAEDTLAGILARHPSAEPKALVALLNGMSGPDAALPAQVLKLPVKARYTSGD